MSKTVLINNIGYYDFYKFSKNFKERYKQENNKELDMDVATYITFNKLYKTVNKISTSIKEDGTPERKIIQDRTGRIPEIEDCVTIMKLDGVRRAKYTDEDELVQAIMNDIESYLNEEENKDVGLIGLFLELIVCFYRDLPIMSGAYKQAQEMRDSYVNGVKQRLEYSELCVKKNIKSERINEAVQFMIQHSDLKPEEALDKWIEQEKNKIEHKENKEPENKEESTQE
jgi:hypothetical protein